ncbi:MAG: hypothetical protein NWE95_05025 [Candidatus Bathyarchaeota archaeon]|nr:hypothetical protein [Candidatus Bathyarchaeota archaeon]
MGKIISSGTIVFDGEKIKYAYRRGELMPNSKEWNNYIETNYHGNPISIDDHGYGEKYAISLLKNELAICKKNQNR